MNKSRNDITFVFVALGFLMVACTVLVAMFFGFMQAMGKGWNFETNSKPAEPPMQAVKQERCAATEDGAAKLLGRWFDNPKILSFHELDKDQGCLLEVELLADADRPESRGFFYVLPDAKHGLNGPLYDRRSMPQVNIGTKQQVEPSEDDLAKAVAQAYRLAQHMQSTNSGASELDYYDDEPQAGADEYGLNQPIVAQQGETLNQALLRELKKAPYIKAVQQTKLEAPAAEAYVLYDSNCPACKHLYDAMDEIANEHNVQFNWVPAYLNDKSWVQAADTIKKLGASNEAGVASLRDTFENPKSNEQVAAISETLDEHDYEQAKMGTAFLLRINKLSPNVLGTPLIFIEGPGGKVSSAYGAVTDSDEWAGLVKKAL